MREIIYGLAGGPPEGREVKCWFPGGSSAPVLTEEHLDLPYTFEAMAEAGSMLGSGAIIVVDDSQPIVPLALRLAEFYRHESCGKCVPCREGTNWTVKMLERIDTGEATPMDLDIIAQVQGNIIGNCLCVLGDSMAMPVGSMIKHFRDEFEQHMEAARARRDLRSSSRSARPSWPRCRKRGRCLMARPEPNWITFEIDGARCARPRARCWWTPPSTATSRSPTSVTSRSSASRWAPAACAWSRSRASRSSRPRARRRCATAWS